MFKCFDNFKIGFLFSFVRDLRNLEKYILDTHPLSGIYNMNTSSLWFAFFTFLIMSFDESQVLNVDEVYAILLFPYMFHVSYIRCKKSLLTLGHINILPCFLLKVLFSFWFMMHLRCFCVVWSKIKGSFLPHLVFT